jgi:glycosyltransferase involved in cell wall biosynthesis
MLSVLIATHNGVDTIEQTLQAMSELDSPRGGWKLIIVNNASTDDSEGRILSWKDRLPLHYLVEPRLGKSVAMNTALSHAEGDFIVMTDDDVLPRRDWLKEWRRVADAYPHLDAFGGAIVPQFPNAPPWPMPDSSLTVLYAATPPFAEGEIEGADVSGPNMAVRASVRDEGWRFGQGFMVGSQGLMGEDSDFIRRLVKAGHGVGFAPNAVVRHIIQEEQMSWWWMQRRFFRHGRTMFMFEAEELGAGAADERAAFPRWRVRRVAATALKLLLAAPRRDRGRTFALARSLAYDLGALKQAWLMRGGRPASLSG